MSVAKVVQIGKAQKDQGQCGKCGKPLPKGSAYLWFKVGFRSNFKRKRCTDLACYPKPSERESSMVAEVMAAQEDYDVKDLEPFDFEGLSEAVHQVAEAARSLAEQYREAADQWENGNGEAEERADGWEAKADELEEWDAESEYSGEEACEAHEHEISEDCEECEARLAAWEDVVDAAEDIVGEATDVM